MKTIIIILIFLAFIQVSILPLNLGLMLILSRAFIRQDNFNFWLAFFFGLLLSHLEHLPLGPLSLLFVCLVEIVYFWSKTAFSKNTLTVLPTVALSLLLVEILAAISKIWPNILVEVALILPVYLLVRFWEERFIVRKEFKLKV